MAIEEQIPRLRLIREALDRALAAQAATQVDQLDIDGVASAIDLALPQDEAAHPLDPEGDGLETDEINAANDV